jgi:hypothetical protein
MEKPTHGQLEELKRLSGEARVRTESPWAFCIRADRERRSRSELSSVTR